MHTAYKSASETNCILIYVLKRLTSNTLCSLKKAAKTHPLTAHTAIKQAMSRGCISHSLSEATLCRAAKHCSSTWHSQRCFWSPRMQPLMCIKTLCFSTNSCGGSAVLPCLREAVRSCRLVSALCWHSSHWLTWGGWIWKEGLSKVRTKKPYSFRGNREQQWQRDVPAGCCHEWLLHV